MLLVGLTGGIGMGKSTVADYLLRRGEKVIDTDLLARELVQPGRPALKQICCAFGDSILTPGGALDRKALARIVFEDEFSRNKLEAILHPQIRQAWRTEAAAWRAKGEERGFVVIPLLYETAAESEFNQVICVSCSLGAQQQRLAARGWSASEIEQRNRAQWPIAQKIERADAVIWNESTTAVCEEQCARVLETW